MNGGVVNHGANFCVVLLISVVCASVCAGSSSGLSSDHEVAISISSGSPSSSSSRSSSSTSSRSGGISSSRVSSRSSSSQKSALSSTSGLSSSSAPSSSSTMSTSSQGSTRNHIPSSSSSFSSSSLGAASSSSSSMSRQQGLVTPQPPPGSPPPTKRPKQEEAFPVWGYALLGSIGFLLVVTLIVFVLRWNIDTVEPRSPGGVMSSNRDLERKLLTRGAGALNTGMSPRRSRKKSRESKGSPTSGVNVMDQVMWHETAELKAMEFERTRGQHAPGADGHLRSWLQECVVPQDSVPSSVTGAGPQPVIVVPQAAQLQHRHYGQSYAQPPPQQAYPQEEDRGLPTQIGQGPGQLGDVSRVKTGILPVLHAERHTGRACCTDDSGAEFSTASKATPLTPSNNSHMRNPLTSRSGFTTRDGGTSVTRTQSRITDQSPLPEGRTTPTPSSGGHAGFQSWAAPTTRPPGRDPRDEGPEGNEGDSHDLARPTGHLQRRRSSLALALAGAAVKRVESEEDILDNTLPELILTYNSVGGLGLSPTGRELSPFPQEDRKENPVQQQESGHSRVANGQQSTLPGPPVSLMKAPQKQAMDDSMDDSISLPPARETDFL